MKDRLFVVVPCYNEEAVLPVTSLVFLEELNYLISLGKVSADSRILFVDDGSRDSTWNIIKELHSKNEQIIGICQSKNRGHQSAVLAGLMEAKKFADITISIDCDGQDDIQTMEEMVDEYRNGYDVVYGVRCNREKDTFFKRFTAEAYYTLLIRMGGGEIIYNHADYRLLSKRVLNELAKYKEVNLFLRGMVPLIGFKSTSVYYERHERIAGRTHYSLKKMMQLAFDGITSLTINPLHIISVFGCIVAGISFIGVFWAIIGGVLGYTVDGWASMICILCFFTGVQMIFLGILGEYIGKVYMEVKHRPRYIISEKVGISDINSD